MLVTTATATAGELVERDDDNDVEAEESSLAKTTLPPSSSSTKTVTSFILFDDGLGGSCSSRD